jgi:Icc-related predicted phosphoesterase
MVCIFCIFIPGFFEKPMKLLITADFHFRVYWFGWLIEQAGDFDLVCIAGDLLDMFQIRVKDSAGT